MAASLLLGQPLTYTGTMATDYIFRPALEVGKLEDYMKVVTGLKVRQQVIFVSPLGKLTVKDAGCGLGEDTTTVTRNEKFWNPIPVKAWFSQCAADVQGTLEESQLKSGNERTDLTNTAIEKRLLDLLEPATYRDLVRMIWLSKSTITAVELTDPTQLKYYNQIDGLWPKLFAGVASGKVNRATIAKNAATTTAAQKLTAAEALQALDDVYAAQNIVLEQLPDDEKVLFVSRSVFRAYRTYLTRNDKLESSFLSLQEGQENLMYMGIPLVIVDVWDQYIMSDFAITTGGNTAYTMPNRIVLTIKDNLQVALDTEATDPAVMEVWYERYQEKWHSRLKYKLDTQIGLEEYVVVGY